MLNNAEIQEYINTQPKYKGSEVAQVDSKSAIGASHLLYKRGSDKMIFIKIDETLVRAGDKKNKNIAPIQSVSEVAVFSFHAFSKAQFEKFALARQYTFTSDDGDTLVLKTWLSTVELLAVIPKKLNVEVIDHKWYEKIVGFRSKNPLKMTAAIVIYGGVLALLANWLLF
ncbi:hypothetical protein [Kurthia sibirica]|uniref:Uncharacterized protein n=1 Tax=Kurthia sibirica TaxID=202750 RepID=A0A2U3APK5_9BACL|nr:hypothetical protein [Kurthia sibirica]PWI26472.1 hypothetical protein DEX24_03845 [Kurthia sibirica]GEK33041.1 hypothetical protein KSI01_05740 [Kurthia sibirica]